MGQRRRRIGDECVKILTGNDLKSGAVTWWTGDGWSAFVNEAVDVGSHGDEIAAKEEAARRVNSPYVIDAIATENGLRPAHIKERIRSLGPTVRTDLTLDPALAASNWVI